jgi:hypothetical protein
MLARKKLSGFRGYSFSFTGDFEKLNWDESGSSELNLGRCLVRVVSYLLR